MSRDDGYALDILLAARAAISFVEGVSEESFKANLEKQSAVLHQLTILGEAARRVSELFRTEHPSVPWVKMSGTRNRIVHEYSEIDLDVVWQIVSRELPLLIAEMETFVSEHP